MGARGRDGSVWLVDGSFTSDTATSFPARKRIAELTGGTGGKVDPTPRFPGIWESSGIIDVKPLFKGRRLVFLAHRGGRAAAAAPR
jgi:hypothetical protein